LRPTGRIKISKTQDQATYAVFHRRLPGHLGLSLLFRVREPAILAVAAGLSGERSGAQKVASGIKIRQCAATNRAPATYTGAGCCWRLVHHYPQQENEMDTNIDKSPKGGTSPGSPGASRAPGDIRSPGLSPDKPALTGSLQDKVGSAVDQARAGIADSASSASADLASDVEKMRADMASMKDTLAKFASEAGGHLGKSAQTVGDAIASQVSATASNMAHAGADMASAAKDQAKTFASELEGMARRQPLASLAVTLFVGIVIGMMGRSRS
jgi:ElaB/YqjD/DUF883 family membrane-anchored ribosome-binding protein